MNIKEISKEIYENNKAKGFWDSERNVGEMLMLVTSELAEALEADRKAKTANVVGFESMLWKDVEEVSFEAKRNFQITFEHCIKDSFEDELADAVIRLFDITHGLGIDLEWHIAAKIRYNKLRPHKHGKSY